MLNAEKVLMYIADMQLAVSPDGYDGVEKEKRAYAYQILDQIFYGIEEMAEDSGDCTEKAVKELKDRAILKAKQEAGHTNETTAFWKCQDIWDTMEMQMRRIWFCSNCGSVRAKGWKGSKESQKPDARFCERCGAKIVEDPNKTEKTRYKKTLWLQKDTADRINHYLTVEPKDESECLGEDRTITYSFGFEGGYDMDIKCCGVKFHEGESNLAWTEAVLFRHGSEVARTEPSDEFFGEWELEHAGNVFTIDIKEIS